MISGVLLLVLTGICWVLIAVVISLAAHRGLDLDFIQAGAALLTAFAAGAVMLLQPAPESSLAERAPVEVAIFFAGVGNYLMIKLMNCGMERGNNGAVWGITQSALLFPFLMGICCFNVAPTGMRICGLLLILTAIVCFSFARSRRPVKRGNWLVPTLGAFLCAGISQCCANLPSYLHLAGMSSPRRAFFVQLGILASFAVHFFLTRTRIRPRGTLPLLLTLALVNIVSLFFFFYNGLNRVVACGAGSIGYPIAMGACISGFFLYSLFVLRERLNLPACIGLAAVLSGIVTIAV